VWDHIVKEKKIIYMAAGPSGDFNRDGRLDLFLANWWIESPSLLLRNETPGGNWLDVSVEEAPASTAWALVRASTSIPPANSATPRPASAHAEIAIGYGYCSGQEAVAHFGLGAVARVDVEVILPHGRGTLMRKDVAANQRLKVGSRKLR